MKRTVLILLGLFIPSAAHAFSVLFYQFEPVSKTAELANITEKRTVSDQEILNMDADALSQYDLFYVDEHATNLAVLEVRKDVIAEAVAMGTSLYVQSHYRNGFNFVPGNVRTLPRQGRRTTIPVQAAWHPMLSKGRLFPDDFNDGKNDSHLVFKDYSYQYTPVAEVGTGDVHPEPVILTGRYGLGKIILRAHHTHLASSAKSAKLHRAMVSWLTDWEDQRTLDANVNWKQVARLSATVVDDTLQPEDNQ